MVLIELGQYPAARSYLAMALQVRVNNLGMDHGSVADVRRDLLRIRDLEANGPLPVEY